MATIKNLARLSSPLNVFDWPGNSADLTLIKEIWNLMKKKSVKLPNNKKKIGLEYHL